MSYGSIDDALSSEAQRTQVEFFIAVSLSLIDSFFLLLSLIFVLRLHLFYLFYYFILLFGYNCYVFYLNNKK